MIVFHSNSISIVFVNAASLLDPFDGVETLAEFECRTPSRVILDRGEMADLCLVDLPDCRTIQDFAEQICTVLDDTETQQVLVEFVQKPQPVM